MSKNNIKIGNKNKIKNSNIGNFKNTEKKEPVSTKFLGCLFKVLTTVTAGVILNWLLQLLNLK